MRFRHWGARCGSSANAALFLAVGNALAACGGDDVPSAGGLTGTDIDPSVIGGDASTEEDAAEPVDARAPRDDARVPSDDADGGQADRDGAAPRGDGGAPDPKPPMGEYAELLASERLVVADSNNARVFLFDTRDRSMLDYFVLRSPPKLFAGQSGRYVYAVQAAAGRVDLLDTGLVQGADGPIVQKVRLSTSPLTGSAPYGFSTGSRYAAAFFDGAPSASFLRESDVEPASSALVVDAGSAHRGVAFAIDETLYASFRSADETRLRRYSAGTSWDTTASFPCTEPSEASVHAMGALVACASGVLRVPALGQAQLLPYPSSLGAAVLHDLTPGPRGSSFLASRGDQLCVVGDAVSCVQLGDDVIDVGFDQTGKRALALTRRGDLHLFDGEALQAAGSFHVISPVRAEVPEGSFPELVAGARYVYVADPEAERVRVLDLSTRTVFADLSIPGASPTKLAIARFPAP